MILPVEQYTVCRCQDVDSSSMWEDWEKQKKEKQVCRSVDQWRRAGGSRHWAAAFCSAGEADARAGCLLAAHGHLPCCHGGATVQQWKMTSGGSTAHGELLLEQSWAGAAARGGTGRCDLRWAEPHGQLWLKLALISHGAAVKLSLQCLFLQDLPSLPHSQSLTSLYNSQRKEVGWSYSSHVWSHHCGTVD